MPSNRADAEQAILDAIKSYEGLPYGPSRRDLSRITGLGTGTCQEIVVNLAHRNIIEYSPLIARSIRIRKEQQ